MKRAVLLALLVLCSLAGCKETIVHDLTESDANQIMTRLYSAGLPGEKIKQPDGGWSIEVSDEDSAKALQLLADARIFRRAQRPARASGSFLSTREQQRFEYERSLSQEIESTLISLDEVFEARVHMNLPVRDPLFGKPLGVDAGSGSVLLVVGHHFSPTRDDVALLVSGASGVPAERISVLLNRATDGVEKGMKEVSDDALEESREVLPEQKIDGEMPTAISGAAREWGWKIAAIACGFFVVFIPLLLRRRRRAQLGELPELFSGLE